MSQQVDKADARQCPLDHGMLWNNTKGKATFCRVCGYDWKDLDLFAGCSPTVPTGGQESLEDGAAILRDSSRC
jgi:hypothetical protein